MLLLYYFLEYIVVFSSSVYQYNTIQYNTIQYNTIQYNTIQYNTIKLNHVILLSARDILVLVSQKPIDTMLL